MSAASCAVIILFFLALFFVCITTQKGTTMGLKKRYLDAADTQEDKPLVNEFSLDSLDSMWMQETTPHIEQSEWIELPQEASLKGEIRIDRHPSDIV